MDWSLIWWLEPVARSIFRLWQFRFTRSCPAAIATGHILVGFQKASVSRRSLPATHLGSQQQGFYLLVALFLTHSHAQAMHQAVVGALWTCVLCCLEMTPETLSPDERRADDVD